MSIVIRTHIVCDNCGTTYGVDMSHLPGSTHRKKYVDHGWIYTDGKDKCPNCRSKCKDGTFVKSKNNRKKRTPRV